MTYAIVLIAQISALYLVLKIVASLLGVKKLP